MLRFGVLKFILSQIVTRLILGYCHHTFRVALQFLSNCLIKASVLPINFSDYPDSALISWMSQEIGNEWLMLGIFLGLKFSYLEGLEKVQPCTRANLMASITNVLIIIIILVDKNVIQKPTLN